MTGRARCALINRDMVGRQRRTREIGKTRAMTADTVTGDRMGSILDLIGATGGIRSRLETHVLRRGVR